MARKRKNEELHDESQDVAAAEAPTPGGVGPGPEQELEEKLAAAEESALRLRADFQNYQRRAIINEREAREWGAAGVLESIVSVIDHFDVALSQDPEKASAASILDGVRLIKGEMLRALKDHGVIAIEPAIGDELDPGRHEAIGHLAAQAAAPGTVSALLQPGYAMGNRVLRPAKVFVAPPTDAQE